MLDKLLRQAKLLIAYISERTQDAERLKLKYSNLGVKVTIQKVDNNDSTSKHRGAIYCFQRNLDFKGIIKLLAEDLSLIENMKVRRRYLELPQDSKVEEYQKVDYIIWLVAKAKTNFRFFRRNVTKVKAKDENKNIDKSNDKCINNLQPVTKVNQPFNSTEPPKSMAVNFTSPKVAINKFSKPFPKGVVTNYCRHCGKKALPSEDTCYSCHSK